MKKIRYVALLIAICLPFSVSAACGSGGDGKVVNETAYELPHYDGTLRDDLDDINKPKYNNELWRRAEIDVKIADPMILDDTENSGYYYAYGTQFVYYKSKDLEKWSYGGGFVSLPSDLSGADCRWAPEVIYDADEEKYFAFFSVHPSADGALEGSPGPIYLPMVAVSDNAAGPFIPVNYNNAGSAGENVREASSDYPQYYAKYALFDNAQYQAAWEREGLPLATNTGNNIYQLTGKIVDGGYVAGIDLHAFYDKDTGDRYLYWSQTPGAIAGVKMTNWMTPDWSTYKTLTACLYYTIEDYVKAMNGELVEKIVYEEMASYCNEGPFTYKHNDKYYLTFSIGSYTESSYAVLQAVSDSPLGPFRKLTDAENGVLLSNDSGENKAVAGTGHHSFVPAVVNGENKLFIAYHAHDNVYNFTDRHTQLDEVKWVTVTDINGQELDVMHVNGPTITVQPTFGIGKQSGDISSKIIKAEMIRGSFYKDSNAGSLIDGLLPSYTKSNTEFINKYVKETLVKATSTFELTLDKVRGVRGIMFYNSINEEKTFEKITDIVFVCEENGVDKNYIIKQLTFDKDSNYFYDIYNEAYSLIRGSSCYAEFNGINVKKIRFTVEVPQGKTSVGFSEVAIVGTFDAE